MFNGVVEGGLMSTTGFAAMIPESAFKSGANELEIYAIESAPD